MIAESLEIVFMGAGAATTAVGAGLAIAQAGRLWGLGQRLDAAALMGAGVLTALLAAVFASLLPGGGP